MNVRKLKNFAKFVSTIPRRHFNMSTFSSSKCDVVEKKTIHTCGTTCCLAGWEVVRKGYGLKNDDNVVKVTKNGVEDLQQKAAGFAAKSLGLTRWEADKLFLPWAGDWNKFNRTPKGAAKRILHFIETGE